MPPALLLFVSLLMQVSRADLIEVDADDAATGEAVVRSAQHQFPEAVRLVSRPGVSHPAGTMLLKVLRKGPGNIHLVLSMGSTTQVQQELSLGGRPERFDIGEAVALALVHLRTRLLDQRTRAAPRRSRNAVRPAPLAAVQPPLAPQEVMPAEVPAPQAQPPAASLSGLVLAPAPLPLSKPGRSWWKLTLAVPLAAAGLAVVAIGATSLTVNGRCVDERCESRFAGSPAGAIEISLGTAAVLAGGSLLAYEFYQRRRRTESRADVAARRVVLLPAISEKPGLALLGVF